LALNISIVQLRCLPQYVAHQVTHPGIRISGFAPTPGGYTGAWAFASGVTPAVMRRLVIRIADTDCLRLAEVFMNVPLVSDISPIVVFQLLTSLAHPSRLTQL